MQKKLTITIDEEVYEGLRRVIGPRKISRFVQEIVRPHVVRPNLRQPTRNGKRQETRTRSGGMAESTFKMFANETE